MTEFMILLLFKIEIIEQWTTTGRLKNF